MKTSADQILFLLKSKGPQTAADLARRMDITGVAVRQHMDGLRAENLVDFEDRREGVGRPRRYWTLSNDGHARFPNGHDELLVDMLDSVRAEFGDAGIDALIRRRERETTALYLSQTTGCKSLKSKIDALAEIRSREGYMAEWSQIEKGRFLFVENHCPICAAARACQGFCRSELAQFQSLFDGLATVERTEHVLSGARRCAYEIRSLKKSNGPAKRRKSKNT